MAAEQVSAWIEDGVTEGPSSTELYKYDSSKFFLKITLKRVQIILQVVRQAGIARLWKGHGSKETMAILMNSRMVNLML